MSLYKKYIKRGIDIVISGLGLIILSPFLGGVSLWLYFANKGAGVFFYQERPGEKAKIFKVVKFKTMNDEKDKDGNLLPDVLRLTRIGKIIRSTSIDELPQLWNVFKGDMSLIGPRPLMVKYLPLYSPEQSRRHEVRPGITGWAQVNGRNSIPWHKKFEYDIWYVDNISFHTDLVVIWKTIKKVIVREGISQEGEATVQPFNGHN